MAASSSQIPFLGREPPTATGLEDHNANTILLRKLSRAVDGHAATATFACGGSIPISSLPSENLQPQEQAPCPPIMIRWDVRSPDLPSKIVLPIDEHDTTSPTSLSALIKFCQPATFGINGRDVLDENYRKAGKLDNSDFSTNFHPHDCGIVDSIYQILLPGTLRTPRGFGIGPQGVRAELYKLNVGIDAPSTT